MRILPVYPNNICLVKPKQAKPYSYCPKETSNQNNNLSLFSYNSPALVNFKGIVEERRTIPDVDYSIYLKMSETQKKILRRKCSNFNNQINESELENKDKKYLPLLNSEDMKKFIHFCAQFNKLKNDPIICLGRSPKWFLNTSLWMKGGIDSYKFVAFSQFWYRKQGYDLIRMSDKYAPTPNEKKAYKKYLKDIQCDPKSIVELAKKTGKKVVITDYINTGKGVTSFLDVMSEFAEQDGILDEFAHSIRIYGIGSMKYTEQFYYDDEYIPVPSVQLPERLEDYNDVIPQEYHDMSLGIFEQMLINENTNECRSTYYPHSVWEIYNPNKYKTGRISSKKMDELKTKCPENAVNFSPAMRDYRNLLNFRILDYMHEKGYLRETLGSKQAD